MFMKFLCRICRRLSTGSEAPEAAATPSEAEAQTPSTSVESVVDDLTTIRGIGISIQERLNRAGITTYAQLADAKPEQVREALGRSSRSAKVEAWISQARKLSASK